MHLFETRVYYEDTDLARIVYYANYLKFIERGRSEWLRDLGLDQAALKREGTAFAVRHLEADYISPARYDDLLSVETRLAGMTPARLTVEQEVKRGGQLLFSAKVTLVCINDAGRPVRLLQALVARVAAT